MLSKHFSLENGARITHLIHDEINETLIRRHYECLLHEKISRFPDSQPQQRVTIPPQSENPLPPAFNIP
jgi:hypothetical protein